MAAAMTGTNGKASRTATVKLTQSRSEKANEKVKAWFMEQNKVVVAGESRGMGWNAIYVSLHKCCLDYAEFDKTLDGDLSDVLIAL